MSGRYQTLNDYGDPANSTAEQFIKEANELLPFSFCCFFFDPSIGCDAARLYDKAALQYRLVKQYDTALKYHLKAAVLAERAASLGDVVSYYREAAVTVAENNSSTALEYFDLAIDTAMRKQDGRLVTRVIADAAAMAEKESMYGYKNRRDVHVSEETYVQEWAQKASRYYAEAYKFAIDCNNKAIAISYEVKHAEMAALRQDYDAAILVFEKTIRDQVDIPSSKFMLRYFMYHSLLCYCVRYSRWTSAEREGKDQLAFVVWEKKVDVDTIGTIDNLGKSKEDVDSIEKARVAWTQQPKESFYLKRKVNEYIELDPSQRDNQDFTFVLTLGNAIRSQDPLGIDAAISEHKKSHALQNLPFMLVSKAKAAALANIENELLDMDLS